MKDGVVQVSLFCVFRETVPRLTGVIHKKAVTSLHSVLE